MEQTIKLSPIQAKEMTVAKNIENSSQILVDFTLFYEDHCKEHPIDLALRTIKAAINRGEKSTVLLPPDMFFQNLDYEEKKIKKTGDWPETFWQKVFHKNVHHEWEETDYDHYRHYWKMVENITIELRNYFWKTGWTIESWKQYPDSEARMIQVHL